MKKNMHLLYCLGGNGNFGDDYIQDSWIRFLSKRVPNVQILVTTGSGWMLPYYKDNASVRLDRFLYTYALASVNSAKNNVLEDNKKSHYIECGTKAAKKFREDHPEWIQLIKSIGAFHVAGGGYINDNFPFVLGFLGFLAELSSQYDIPLYGTGLGLLPLKGELESVIKLFSKFRLLDVRDEKSYNFLVEGGLASQSSITCDDTFILPVNSADIIDRPKRLYINVQRDSGLGAVQRRVIAPIKDLIASSRVSGFDVVYVKFFDRSDSAMHEVLSRHGIILPVISRHDLMSGGLPFKREDVCLTSRFHFHLLASRLGAKGIVIHNGGAYYSAKHDSVMALGSNWKYFSDLERNGRINIDLLSDPSIDESFHKDSKLRIAEEIIKAY